MMSPQLPRVIALTLLLVFISREHCVAAELPPNIVLIMADDLGYRELGCYGQTLIRTPNIDRLAAQGMMLTQHYSGNTVCAPSRCVLMTGRHPGHAFIRNNRSVGDEGELPIPDSEITIAELLREHDYATGAFGKWGLGGPNTTGCPLNQGFDHFLGYLDQRLAHSYYPAYLRRGNAKLELNNLPPVPGHAQLTEGSDPDDPNSYDIFKGQDYAPDHINAAALNFIRSNTDRPFFCYYPSIIPHVALHVPDEDLKPYHDLGWDDPPFTGAKVGYTPHFTPRAAYASMISRLDTYVGRILDLLDELDLTDNTVVIFTSDNGTTTLTEEVDVDFFNSVGNLRGLKGSLYEGGVRVPAIVRWPNHVAAGSRSDFVSGLEDWMPTILQVTGHQESIPESSDGISLVPTLLGQTQDTRPYLYREFAGYGAQQSIRSGDWKAVRQQLKRNVIQTELYNLSIDPGEQRDVAANHPDIVQRLTDLMASERVPSREFPIPALD